MKITYRKTLFMYEIPIDGVIKIRETPHQFPKPPARFLVDHSRNPH